MTLRVAIVDDEAHARTAIRILMELLVNHLPDLETGRVVPVGDAFDALAESGDPIDVLDGIAYDSAGQRLFVTGKRWPTLFEVRLAMPTDSL